MVTKSTTRPIYEASVRTDVLHIGDKASRVCVFGLGCTEVYVASSHLVGSAMHCGGSGVSDGPKSGR